MLLRETIKIVTDVDGIYAAVLSWKFTEVADLNISRLNTLHDSDWNSVVIL